MFTEYKSIARSKGYFESDLYDIKNDLIKRIDINVNIHYGGLVSLEIAMNNYFLMSGGYNTTKNIGHMIQFLIQLLDINEDYIKLSNIKDFPIRVVFEKDTGKPYAFGNFMNNQFVIITDLLVLNLEK